MTTDATILWFRQDLRLADNAALSAAVARGGTIIPVYIWSPQEEGSWPIGSASRWWLHHSLIALDRQLHKHRCRLVIRKGESAAQLQLLAVETGARTVFWTRRYEPAAIQRDCMIEMMLEADGIETAAFNGPLLFEPDEIRNSSGQPFRVFTPFYKYCMGMDAPDEPLPVPTRFHSPKQWPASLEIDQLGLLDDAPDRDQWLTQWSPGEAGGAVAVEQFISQRLVEYERHRDRPDVEGTSRLSPHLHFGEISPRELWHAVRPHTYSPKTALSKASQCYMRQLVWREFAYHLLYHFPHTDLEPLRPQFSQLPWREDADELRAWQDGRTGYPIVDAGMRELAETGWMHNRVRMIVASFLVKDLLISWHEGARWFWEMLVDADLANNSFGWQWTAGCGADAAPYFRIFNPVRQGERFDPTGAYIRQYVPELRDVPNRWIHAPFKAGTPLTANGNQKSNEAVYAHPIVDHAVAHRRALEAFCRHEKIILTDSSLVTGCPRREAARIAMKRANTLDP